MTTEVQSVIFPKNKFTEQQATNWIIKNNFTTKGKKIKNFKTTKRRATSFIR